MQKKLEQIIKTYPKVNFEDVWDELASSEIISFNVFNTLLKTNITTEDNIFEMVENIWNKSNKQKLLDFKSKRKYAQKIAQIKYGFKTNLDNIYEELDVPGEVKFLEKKIHINLTQENQPIFEIFKSLKKLNRRIIIIANTYLSKDDVIKMLQNSGYDYYEKIYISNEFDVDNQIHFYNKILAQLGVLPQKIKHLGDQLLKDYLIPKKIGVKPILIPKVIKNVSLPKVSVNNNDLNFLNPFINNQLAKYEYDRYQKLGYSSFGTLIFGFSQWIGQNISSNQKVFFLARDGFVLQEAFNKIYTDQKTTYLNVSRRSLQVPGLIDTDTLEQVLEIINLSDKFTGRDFLMACGIEKPSQDSSLAKEFTIKDNQEELNELYQKYQKSIKQNANLEFDLLVKYLKQNGFEKNVAIVDVGWHANKQRALEKICSLAGIKVKITGYYLGLVKNENGLVVDNAHGYWFDQVKNKNDINKAKPIRGLIEFLFSAKHGTTITYELNNKNEAVAVLAPYEYVGNHELVIQGQLLKTIRTAGLQFVTDFSNSNLYKLINLEPTTAVVYFEKNSFKPTKDIMSQFNDFIFIDRNVKYLISPHSNLYYVFHLKQFKNDFLISRWPIGLLKRVVKLPMDYLNMYRRLMKLFKINN